MIEEEKIQVVSAGVTFEKREMIVRSSQELERSISWVMNKVMELGWDEYFKQYPLEKAA